MKTIYSIEKGQYLTDILSEIPSNIILSKTITGIGATTAEIKAKRHSIIIVPNKPVIEGKCRKHHNLIGVYEGVSEHEIAMSMLSADGFCKIMTTPESYLKVRKACEMLNINIYDTFFILCDEAHQYIDDADYRESIVLPMDDFFKFKNKAMVSATLLEFSDPRFKAHSFTTVKVVPNYPYKHKITAISTQCIFAEVKRLIQSTEKCVCIFLNNVDMIYSIIDQLGIAEESAIFCSDKSKRKVKGEYKYSSVHSSWNSDKMKRYSFFTSRFFNAFDLELSYNPDVIMITDANTIQYTMLDIDTDCIQILGRFRNGISSATHIFNTNPNIPYKTAEQSEWEISALKYGYDVIKGLFDNAVTDVARFAFGSALETFPFKQYLRFDGKINYYAIDCSIHNSTVKGIYKDTEYIRDRYLNNPIFDMELVINYYPHDLEKLIIKHSKETVKEKRKASVKILSELNTPPSEVECEILSLIRECDPLIVEAYELLGKEGIEKVRYSEKGIKEAMILKKRHSTIVKQLVQNSFNIGYRYSNNHIVSELSRIFQKCGLFSNKEIRPNLIQDYFQATPCKVRKERGYYIDRLLM